MDLKTFLSLKTNLIEIPLPGLNAHSLLAPPNRITDLKKMNYNIVNFKIAAVLILFFPRPNGQLNLVLIERSKYPGIHSGQISFPGGKYEDQDNELWETALREANEEIGIQKSDIKYVMSLSNIFIPPSNFLVTPFLSYTISNPAFIPYKSEVSKIIELPVNDLLKMKVSQKKIKTVFKESVEVPCFNYNQNIIWGATSMVLSELKMIILNALDK
tara:strand:- start:6159 stop:6803 length:645 start_codon:yes stop_codon:yes gene_type:complete